MKQRFAIAALVAAISVGGSLAEAAVINPFATLQVGGAQFDLNLIADPTKSGRLFFDEIVGDLDVDGFEIFASGTLDADPSASYSLTVTNGGAVPLNVSLLLGTPFAPLAASTITSGITGTLTPGPLDALGLSMLPILAAVMTSTDGAANLGVDVGPAATLVGPLAAIYGPFTGGQIPGPPGLSGLQVQVGLTLTGGGDVAALSGSTIVTAVPEPAMLTILGIGLFATAARSRRRRRAAR